ncbi:MAG: hypothetical protein Alpg2KO_07900 [Alphaproteobacteria bacterium]
MPKFGFPALFVAFGLGCVVTFVAIQQFGTQFLPKRPESQIVEMVVGLQDRAKPLELTALEITNCPTGAPIELEGTVFQFHPRFIEVVQVINLQQPQRTHCPKQGNIQAKFIHVTMNRKLSFGMVPKNLTFKPLSKRELSEAQFLRASLQACMDQGHGAEVIHDFIAVGTNSTSHAPIKCPAPLLTGVDPTKVERILFHPPSEADGRFSLWRCPVVEFPPHKTWEPEPDSLFEQLGRVCTVTRYGQFDGIAISYETETLYKEPMVQFPKHEEMLDRLLALSAQ